MPPLCSMLVVSSETAVGLAWTCMRTVIEEDTLGAELMAIIVGPMCARWLTVVSRGSARRRRLVVVIRGCARPLRSAT
jgi:hypothetical protein